MPPKGGASPPGRWGDRPPVGRGPGRACSARPKGSERFSRVPRVPGGGLYWSLHTGELSKNLRGVIMDSRADG